ncbi:hypothetical protein Pla52n_11580 [Stieleria varia]|uniref:Uncharacterized protein n=1 Tax=Stieleria varia TaxID=2528005 RepID=A0A5C6B8J1_9BACT|nr:hypothetical protein Pla52n_11580 [Stieleria varia]
MSFARRCNSCAPHPCVTLQILHTWPASSATVEIIGQNPVSMTFSKKGFPTLCMVDTAEFIRTELASMAQFLPSEGS